MGDRKKYSVSDSRLPAFTNAFRKMVDEIGGVSAMSEKTGISRPTINFWYNGQRTPDAENLIVLSSKLGVSADYLLGLSDAPTNDKTAAAAVDYTGLAPDTVKFLHEQHCGKLIQDGLQKPDRYAPVIDFLVSDTKFSLGGSDYNPLLKAISVFLELDASAKKRLYVLDTDGEIKPIKGGASRGVRPDEIGFDSDMTDAIALTAITQKLTAMKRKRQQEKDG